MLVAQLCLTLCDPMDCSPQGSSVHEIFQARILEWVAISFSRGSSQSRDRTPVSCTAGRFFTDWATREAKPREWTSININVNFVRRQRSCKSKWRQSWWYIRFLNFTHNITTILKKIVALIFDIFRKVEWSKHACLLFFFSFLPTCEWCVYVWGVLAGL